MTFPLWYLLPPYTLVVFGTGVFTFFNVYHVAKFGLQSVSSSILVGIYVVSYCAVLLGSLLVFGGYDWSQMTSVGDIVPFFGTGSANFGL